MGAWLRRNPMTAMLAVLGALLAVVLLVEFYTAGPDMRPVAARRAVPAEAKLLPPLAATAPEQAYPEIAARPLFAPTRRPAPPVVATPQPTIQRNQFVLMGVIMAGDTRIAMLREKSSGRLVRVERGAEVNGMKVASIEREAVTLAAGAERNRHADRPKAGCARRWGSCAGCGCGSAGPLQRSAAGGRPGRTCSPASECVAAARAVAAGNAPEHHHAARTSGPRRRQQSRTAAECAGPNDSGGAPRAPPCTPRTTNPVST